MYNKEGKITLETSAKYNLVGQTNIVFYDTDLGTADLVFYLTRYNKPLEVSNENVEISIILEAKDGSYIEDKAEIEDPLQGKVRYTIPNELLQHTGTINGQTFIGIEDEKVVTQSQFSFTVEASLGVSAIPSIDKVKVIRSVEELKETVREDIKSINEALTKGNDYVSEINSTLESGMKTLNDKSTKSTSELSNQLTSSLNEINKQKEIAVKNLYDSKNDIMQYIADKRLISYTDVEAKLNTLTWQKYKTTNDDGSSLYDSMLSIDFNDSEQLKSLGVGTRYAANTLNAPSTNTSRSGWITKYSRGAVQLIEFRPYNSTQIFIKRFYNTWSDWERVNPTPLSQSDTGWITFNLINGALSNTEFIEETGFVCAYRSISIGNQTTNYIRVNGRNLTNGQVIAQIPTSLIKYKRKFRVLTAENKPAAYITIKLDGSITFTLDNANQSNWAETDYIYDEIRWLS